MRAGRWGAMAGLLVLCGCPAAVRPPPPPGPEVGYVEWTAQRPWTLADLRGAAIGHDRLRDRGDSGDARAALLAQRVADALWIARTHLLPALRALPGDEEPPADDALATRRPLEPEPELEGAAAEWRTPLDRGHAVERLLTVAGRERNRRAADEARLLRVLLALEPFLPPALPEPGEALAEAVRALDPDGVLLLPASALPDRTDCPAGADGSPACLWARLAAQAAAQAGGAEALPPGALGEAAVALLARRGLLRLAVLVLLPTLDDPNALLQGLGQELILRLSRAWGLGDPLPEEPEPTYDPDAPFPEGDDP